MDALSKTLCATEMCPTTTSKIHPHVPYTDRITNDQIIDRAGMPDIEMIVREMQLRWAGHVIESQNSCCCCLASSQQGQEL